MYRSIILNYITPRCFGPPTWRTAKFCDGNCDVNANTLLLSHKGSLGIVMQGFHFYYIKPHFFRLDFNFFNSKIISILGKMYLVLTLYEKSNLFQLLTYKKRKLLTYKENVKNYCCCNGRVDKILFVQIKLVVHKWKHLLKS